MYWNYSPVYKSLCDKQFRGILHAAQKCSLHRLTKGLFTWNEKIVSVGGHGHLKSKRWFEITAVVHVKIKQCRGTHLIRVKLSLRELSLPWQKSRPPSNPKALSSVWTSFKSPVRFVNCQDCSMLFFRHSFELISTVISKVTNNPLILARNFSVYFYFRKLPWQPCFRTSPCQWRRSFKMSWMKMSGHKKTLNKNLNKRKITSRRILCILSKNCENLSQISALNVWESGVLDRSIDRSIRSRINMSVKNPRFLT